MVSYSNHFSIRKYNTFFYILTPLFITFIKKCITLFSFVLQY